jgi:hypothetical protein
LFDTGAEFVGFALFLQAGVIKAKTDNRGMQKRSDLRIKTPEPMPVLT